MNEPLISDQEDVILAPILEEKPPTTSTDLHRAFSKPTQEKLHELEEIRHLPFLGRLFRKMGSGSMRGVVLMWIRMTLGIGILTLPFYIKNYGAITGLFFIVAAALVNNTIYKFIFEASDATNTKNYPDLIHELLGPTILRIFRVTYMLDITSGFMIYSIVSWNLLEYMMYFFKIGESRWDKWFVDLDKIKYNEMNPEIFAIRGIFFAVVFVCSVPLFLKRNLEALQKITIGYLVALFALVIIILIEVPSFRAAYKDHNIGFYLYKVPTYTWIECFLGLCVTFYVQPFMFSLRGELLNPILRREKKIAKTSVAIELFIFMVLGFLGYFSLGDEFTPNLFILRKPYPNKSEISENIFRFAIGLFFLLNTLGLAMYNPSLRDYLYTFIADKESKTKFVVVSLLPFFIICCIAFAYPFVVDVTNLFGLTVYNFNGYIMPFMLRAQTLRRRGERGCKLAIAYGGVAFFIALGITGIVFRIMGKVVL